MYRRSWDMKNILVIQNNLSILFELNYKNKLFTDFICNEFLKKNSRQI